MALTSSPDLIRTQVLVVGAGPVGLLAAVKLRQQGIDIRVIDQQPPDRAHAYPVVLHPQSLRLLKELGVSAAMFWRGRPVTRLAVYTEYERRAVLDLPMATGVACGVLTMPQDVVRQALLNELERSGVAVEWNTRLAVLEQGPSSVWGRLVQETPARRLLGSRGEVSSFEADFVIGADGYDSTVRESLGIQLVSHGPLQSYAFFDATTRRSGNEGHIALSEHYSNSVYPLQGGQSRFSFQLGSSLNEPLDPGTLKELLLARMPWYGEDIASCDWCGVAEFRRALVDHYGKGRVWLAGEAAHLTGPLGVQSLNVGLDEASELAQRMADALMNPSQAPFGELYSAKRTRQWRALLGIEPRVSQSPRTPDWARRHLRSLLACLPASGADLDELLDQLRLTPVPGPPED
jgi:2-polyprenyl-6-methoxyphenol hydroxylase-like FAD-dependent oxidoreductase